MITEFFIYYVNYGNENKNGLSAHLKKYLKKIKYYH